MDHITGLILSQINFVDERGEMIWITDGPESEALLGYIPQFVSALDPRPVVEQLNANYAHGGGWHKFEGFRLEDNLNLVFPASSGGPEERYRPIAFSVCRDEAIVVYKHAWVMVLHKETKTWEVARLD